MRMFKGFFVVMACFSLLLLPLVQSDSLAACTPAVQIVGHAYPPTSIQDAYDFARANMGPDFTLRLSAEVFTENLTLDDGNVTIDGGYDCTFTTKESTTGIFGTVIIGGTGSVNFAGEVGVVSTDQCSFDPDGDGYFCGSCAPLPIDCDCNDPNINPGAVEVCDGVDNNCDGQIDEGVLPIDADNDGYFDVNNTCGDPALNDDCNDADPTINPGALEIPYNGIDEDCDGVDLTFTGDASAIAACVACHPGETSWPGLHVNVTAPAPTAPVPNCDTCHNQALVGMVLPGHYGQTVLTDGNNMLAGATIICASCHDMDGTTYPHTGGAIGSATNFVWSQVEPVPVSTRASVTCDTCHENRAAVHADTGLAHDNRIIDTNCAACHTNPGTGTLTSAADVDGLHLSNCALCHGYTGTLVNAAVVRQVIEDGVTGTQISCLDCHVGGHGAHSQTIVEGPGDLSYDAPGQLCSECHIVSTWAEIEGVEHNVATNGDGSCATCHNSPRQEVIDAIALGANPINCLDCHSDKYLTVHGNFVHPFSGASVCQPCHSETDPTAIVATTHNNNCGLCHTSVPALHSYVPPGASDCVTCHITTPEPDDTWENIHTPNVPIHNPPVGVGTTGCADCHDNTLYSAENDTHDGCFSCHDVNGVLTGRATGVTFAAGDCVTCHDEPWNTTHLVAPNHAMIVTVVGTSCGTNDCHADTPLTSAALNTHNDCISCHDATSGVLISLAAGKAAPGNCVTCHMDTWDVTHTNVNTPSHNPPVQVGTSSCGTARCHSTPPPLTDENDPEVHNTCSSCHNPDGTLTSLATGKDFETPGDCTICHINNWDTTHTTVPDHANLVTVIGTTCGTTNCHDDTLVGVESHNDCASCHDATTGALLSHAIGKDFDIGGNCTTCHTDPWVTTHTTANTPDHTPLVTVVGTGTTGTGCAYCHLDPPPLVELGNAENHSTCGDCHDVNGILTGDAAGKDFITGGTCLTCHTNGFDTIHTAHLHTVAEGPGDLAYQPPGQLCSACHVVSTWAEIEGTEHNVPTNGAGSCNTCHNSPRQEVIDAIAAGADPTNCLDCHTADHAILDHVALGYVTVGSPVTPCLNCHDAGVPVNGTVITTHLNNCTLCHTTGANLQPGIPAGGGDCVTCHNDPWNIIHPPSPPDHTPLVTVIGTSCGGSCHQDPPPLVDPGNLENHNSCDSCHDADGLLRSLAIGKDFTAGGNCSTCHIDPWVTTHTNVNTPDHTPLVTVTGTSCGGSCHSDPPPLINAGDPKVHNDCFSCHNVDGSPKVPLVGLTFDLGGNCQTCHAGTWEGLHITNTPNHTPLVTVTGTGTTGTGCAYCHLDPPPLVDPANAENHNTCGTCHNVAGAPTTPGDFTTGGTCLTCHTTGFDTIHTAHLHTVAEGPGDLSYEAPGQLCSACHVVSTWAEIEGTEHNVATNGAGSCNTCHNSPRQDVIDAIAAGADPTNCLACHLDKELTVHGDVDHVALGYVTVGSPVTPCLNCHDAGVPVNGTVITTHLNTCTLCHTTGKNLQPGIPLGGGDCNTCHITAPEPDETWEGIHTPNAPSHTTLVTVVGSTCGSCHSDPPPLVEPGNLENHNGCATCHDLDGTPTTPGDFTAGGNCSTCHIDPWVTTHTNVNTPDHTPLVTVTGTGTTGTGCGTCHLDPPPLVELGNAENHNACGSCHTAIGGLTSSALGKDFTTGGTCLTCHTTGFDTIHTAHLHTVAEGPGDLSYEAPGQLCSVCHVVSTWAEIEGTEHNVATNGAGSCNTCHNSTRQDVIDAIAAGADPTNCLACHLDKELTVHGDVDHVALGYVTVGSPVTPCLNCHDAGVPVNGTVITTHLNTCSLCHTTGKNLQPGIPLGGGDCNTCHITAPEPDETWEGIHTPNAPSHTTLVTVVGSTCGSCHSDPPPLVEPGNLENHNGCATCHDVDGTPTTPGDFTAGGNCSTCHIDPWVTTHTNVNTPDHTPLVTVAASSCGSTSCHSDPPPLVEAGNPKNHNTCGSCHAVDGVPTTPGDFITGGECATCHTEPFNVLHAGSCSTCHGGGTSGSVGTNYWPDASNANAENDTPGRHKEHMDVLSLMKWGYNSTTLLNQPDQHTKQLDLCGYCHSDPGGSTHGNGSADTGFANAWNKAADADGIIVGGSCSNINCHNNQATGSGTYGWLGAGTSTCVMCHTPGGANTAVTANPASGLHHLTAANTTAHDGAFGPGDAFNCEDCHVKANITNHIDGVAKNANYTGSEVGVNVATLYTDAGGTAANRGSCLGTSALGSCHSDGGNWSRQWSTDANIDIVANPDPGQAVCNVCHGQYASLTSGSGWSEGTSHAGTFGGTASEKGRPHDGDGSDAEACEDCHAYQYLQPSSKHLNGLVTMNDDIATVGDTDFTVDSANGNRVYCDACHNSDGDPTSANSHTFPEGDLPYERIAGAAPPTMTCFAGAAGCHGDDTDYWWPANPSIDPSVYPNRAGAHPQHNITIGTMIARYDPTKGGTIPAGTYNTTDNPRPPDNYDFNRTCVYCHSTKAFHVVGAETIPADVYQDGQPGNQDPTDKFIFTLDDPNNPGSWYPLDPDGTYAPFDFNDRVNQPGTCSNIDCHGNAPYTPHWYGDFVKPGTVTNLAAVTHDVSGTHIDGVTDTPGTVVLTWNAPGDDLDLDGQAYQYEVRYSTSSINEGNFLSATRAGSPPTVARKGAAQKMIVNGLTPGQSYYFAVRTYDETYDPSEAQNVSDVAATSSAVTAHADDMMPIFRGVERVELSRDYNFDGNKVTSGVVLHWSAAKDHTLPITYRIWWSTYALKTHIALGGDLPEATTIFCEDSQGGIPYEQSGGSCGVDSEYIVYTLSTGSTEALKYAIDGLDVGALYNFIVRARDGSPALNTDDNLVGAMAVVQAMDALPDDIESYLANATNNLVLQSDPASPVWPGESSYRLEPGTSITWTTGSSLAVDTNIAGVSFDIYAEGGRDALQLQYELGYATSGGSWVQSLGNAPIKSRTLGKRSKRVQKLSLFEFKDMVPAGYKLAVRLSAPASNSRRIELGYGTDTTKGQLFVMEQDYNHAPDAPSGISVTEQLYGGYLDIDWTASNPNDSGQTVTYDVLGSVDNGITYPYVIATDLSGTSVTWDTVGDNLIGNTYDIKVKVLANDGYLYETGQPEPNRYASTVAGISSTYFLDNTLDTEAPASTTIKVWESRPKQGTAYLEWNAVGDDGLNHGTRAAVYDIRYNKTSAGPFDFDTASQAEGEPVPDFAGRTEVFELLRLEPEADYYVGMKVGDKAGNWSALSNVITIAGGPKYCGICHATPPDEPAMGGTHAAHGYTLQDCAKCHGDEVLSYTVRHYDGVLKVGWARDANGNKLPPVEADIVGNNVSYSQFNGSQMVKIYEDTDGSGGFNPTGTFNVPQGYHGDSGSCMNFVDPTGGTNSAYASGCHGPFVPKWADGADGAQETPECADCHGDKTAARDLDPYGRIWDDNIGGNPTDEVLASPPIDNHGFNFGRYVGAHLQHLNSSTRLTGDPCAMCHKGVWENGEHADMTNDVIFDAAADKDLNNPAVFTPNASGPGTPGSCGSLNAYNCHDTGATWTTGTDTKCNDCHGFFGQEYTVGAGSSEIGHVMDGGLVRECTHCHVGGHPQSPDGVNPGDPLTRLLPNYPVVGINYRSGGVHLRLATGNGSDVPFRTQMNDGETIDTLAETCWGCHEDNGVSEWGTNTSAMTGNSTYDFGSIDKSGWVGAIWSSANFAYKTGYIQSTHTTDPTGTSQVTWDATNGRYNEMVDTVDKIRCSNCHDVHNTNLAPGDTMTGRPYLRGSWMANPYEEDGAPFSQDYNTPTYSPSGASQNRYGAVPRGGTAYGQLGGYYIDQNNVVPGTGVNATPTPAPYPTSGWTLQSSAGLCTLCHGTDIDNLDMLTGEDLWIGTNGHSNSTIGGTFTNAANIFDFTHGRPIPVTVGDKNSRAEPTDNEFNNQVPSMGYISQMDSGDTIAEGHGYRGTAATGEYTGGYTPYTEPDSRAYSFLDYDWGASVDAGSTDVLYHQFSCSKCHSPHASRLPKLMITNCLDIRHNTWDDAKSSSQTLYTASALADVDQGKKAAYYASAQNCHRYDDSRSTQQLKGGWNKVTPWEKDNLNNQAHP